MLGKHPHDATELTRAACTHLGLGPQQPLCGAVGVVAVPLQRTYTQRQVHAHHGAQLRGKASASDLLWTATTRILATGRARLTHDDAAGMI